MKNDFQNLLVSFEEKIKAGQILEVRKKIQELKKQKISRPYLVKFAAISRRVREDFWGLQLLRPILRSKVPVHPAPSIEEKTIYAALLIKIDAINEALNILNSMKWTDHPDILLYTGYAYIAEWNYKKAVPYLKKYIKQPGLTEYQRTIAQVNLAASLEHLEEKNEAFDLLNKLLLDCKKNNWTLLEGNCLEISTQLAIQENNWPLASTLLEEAKNKAGLHSQYILFIEKWKAVMELKKNNKSKEGLSSLTKVREMAREQKNWETLRDCDLQEATTLENTKLLTSVYYGSAHLSYKTKIEKMFLEKKWSLPKEFIWQTTPGQASSTFDLTLGLDEEKKIQLRPGQILHRLLIILASDFYQPFSVGKLFSKLYPDEYFNPDSSPDRIFFAVKKAREWFKKNKIPLEITVLEGHFRLKMNGPYAIRKTKRTQTLRADDNLLNKLKNYFPHKSFSASQAAKSLEISPTSSRLLLQNAFRKENIFSSGNGRSKLYRFKK